MSDNRVIIRHKDGREYSVTRKAHEDLYPDFKIVGEESDESFVTVGVPKPKAPRRKAKAKAARPIAVVEPVAEPVAEPAEA